MALSSDPRGPTYTEQHRHQCEVRHVLAMPSRMARLAYIEGATGPDGKLVKGIRQCRGDRAADQLRDDVRAAWTGRRRAEEVAGDRVDG